MKFTFTPFDKAIVAAIIGPLIVLGTSWMNCVATVCSTPVVWPRDYLAAAAAAVIAGVTVYLKGNASPQQSQPVVKPGP